MIRCVTMHYHTRLCNACDVRCGDVQYHYCVKYISVKEATETTISAHSGALCLQPGQFIQSIIFIPVKNFLHWVEHLVLYRQKCRLFLYRNKKESFPFLIVLLHSWVLLLASDDFSCFFLYHISFKNIISYITFFLSVFLSVFVLKL